VTTEPISLHEVAERLGVHYMTIYRYVRTGRLRAVRVGSTWRVDTADLEDLFMAGTGAAPRGGGLDRARSRLQARLVAGDEAGAWDLVERALASGTTPEEVLVGLVGRALEDIGSRWAKGELSVGGEHRASAVAIRLVSRLGARFTPRGRKRGTVILAGPPGELHSLPISIATDILRWQGFAVVDLGADTPPEALAEAARREPGVLAIGVACTTYQTLGSAPSAVAAVHDAVPGLPVLIGGGAVAGPAHAASLGADRYTGRVATDLLGTVEELASPSRIPAAGQRTATGQRDPEVSSPVFRAKSVLSDVSRAHFYL
jgi:excisionase family DNA binding protein